MVAHKNWIFKALIIFGLFISWDWVQAQTPPPPPNVIIIYADDLGIGDLSCYGARQIETPNIDQLAQEGIRFTDAHSMASTCTPSRYSLLTGEYAFRNKQAHILPGDASMLISSDKTTLASLFQNAGYATGIVGKWHIGLGPIEGPDWNGVVKPGPNEVGFDYSFIFPATADRVPTIYLENGRVIAWEANDSIEVSYQHQVGKEPTVKDHPELLKMKSSNGHDGTIINGIGRIGWMKGGKLARWTDEELGGDFLAVAQRFIEVNQDRPFFLYYPMNEIHVPRMPATPFKGQSKLGYRGDVILEMDYLVGEILKTLDHLNLRENTLIVFSSDNGPVLDDGYVDFANEKAHGHRPSGVLRGGKYSLYEGGTRMPFIVNWPAHVQPSVSNALVNQTDLLASFSSLLNVKLEEGQGEDSQDLLETLLGRSDQGRSYNIGQENSGALSYTKGDWKYIPPRKGRAVIPVVNIETGYNENPQLYNLKEDIGESVNLAKKYPSKVQQMARELERIKGIE